MFQFNPIVVIVFLLIVAAVIWGISRLLRRSR